MNIFPAACPALFPCVHILPASNVLQFSTRKTWKQNRVIPAAACRHNARGSTEGVVVASFWTSVRECRPPAVLHSACRDTDFSMGHDQCWKWGFGLPRPPPPRFSADFGDLNMKFPNPYQKNYLAPPSGGQFYLAPPPLGGGGGVGLPVPRPFPTLDTTQYFWYSVLRNSSLCTALWSTISTPGSSERLAMLRGGPCMADGATGRLGIPLRRQQAKMRRLSNKYTEFRTHFIQTHRI